MIELPFAALVRQHRLPIPFGGEFGADRAQAVDDQVNARIGDPAPEIAAEFGQDARSACPPVGQQRPRRRMGED